VAYLIGQERHDKAKDFLGQAEEHLDELDDFSAYRSYAESLRGAFMAYEIGMNRSKAVWLGPRSMKHINRAVELDPGNPIAWMEKGNAEYHMPRIFGGSYHKAAEYFGKAIRLFESGGYDLQCNWRYLNALAWLAQSYDKAGKPGQASHTYRKILDREPRFEWVRDELYPAFAEDHPGMAD
jgi:tetratricopeptide (TPR) repeat protein